MMNHDNDKTVVESREHLQARVSDLDELARQVDQRQAMAEAQQSTPVPRARSSTLPPPPPPQASTQLTRAISVVGSVSKTSELLQLAAQLQMTLCTRYYRARCALAALSNKHTSDLQTLLGMQRTEAQALKQRHDEAMQRLLERQEEVEGEMRRELEQLKAALELGPKAEGEGQCIAIDDAHP